MLLRGNNYAFARQYLWCCLVVWYLVVGCWYLVVGCWYLVVSCWYLVVGCWYLVVGIGFQPKLPTTYNR